MPVTEPSFTVGIEEEYLLVDPTTRALIVDPTKSLLADCNREIKGLVRPEFLRSQVEVGTTVCRTVAEARDSLAGLRRTVAEVSRRHGLTIIAASTHPFAPWLEQKHTARRRYDMIAKDLQAVVRRLLACGMHVHVGVEHDEARIDLINQVSYFLPHLLALSTSSPFWQGEETGLMSYRLSVFDDLPRTGLPERFESYAEYQRHVNVLVRAGLIPDATMLWWDVRPSARFPTIEMRVTDVCTFVDDAIAIAATFACILRMLFRLRRDNQRWRLYTNMLLNENRWRAQRYGFDEGLVDFGKGELVSFPDLLEELLGLIKPDAEALDCEKEVRHLRKILKRGTSAHRQLATFRKKLGAGKSREEALKGVVDMLIRETMKGL